MSRAISPVPRWVLLTVAVLALVFGVGSLATPSVAGFRGEVPCSTTVMAPGDSCFSSDEGMQTYAERSARFQRVTTLFDLVGWGLVVVGVLMLAVALRAALPVERRGSR